MKKRTKLIMVFLLGVVIFLGGVVVYFFYTNTAPPKVLRIPILASIIVCVSLLVSIVIGTKLARRHSGNHLTLKDAAENLNLQLHIKPDKNYHRPFADLNIVKRSGTTHKLLTGSLDHRPLTIFSHTYMVYTGQATIPVSHTVYATPAPPWPEVRILRRHFFFRVREWFGMSRSIKLENLEFNRAFRVVVDPSDEDFAITLLSPEMQKFLLEKPGVSWIIDKHVGEPEIDSGDARFPPPLGEGQGGGSGGNSGGGWVCLVYRGPLKSDRINASLNRLRQFWELIPPELESWESLA